MESDSTELPAAKATYSAHLGEDDINALKRLLGVGVCEIFSSSLEADRMLLTAPSFSFRLDSPTWVVVRSEWLETPGEWLDYYRLSVKVCPTPDGIKVAEDGALVEPSHILLVPSSNISAIEVLSLEDPSDGPGTERTTYDRAIRFFRGDGRHFCMAAQTSIAEQVHFSEDPVTITKLLDGCSVRLRIA